MEETATGPHEWERHGGGTATILGVRIDRMRLPEMLRMVREAATHATRLTVLYVNVHCINIAQQDSEYARVLDEADVVYCDGTGVRLGAWLARQSLPERMTGADWIEDLCRTAVSARLSIYLLGGEPNVARDTAAVLRSRYPQLRIAGCSDGFDIDPALIQEINVSRPDILLVGMGTPRQEKWIAHNRDRLQVPVVWAVGALFSFVSGRIPRGPHVMTAHGLEWMCRLAAEPRKLWRRYLIGNPVFLWRVLRAYRLSSGAWKGSCTP